MSESAANTLVHDVLTSRVYDVARETPLDPAPRLSRRLAAEVLLKREDLQPVFSFKLRGAYNRIASLDGAERARGVIAASAGNHAQGVAFSARAPGAARRDRDAGDDARDQGRGGAGDGRRGGARGRQLLRCPGALRRAGRGDRPRLRAPVRRPAGDRGPGHDRRRDAAPVPRAARRGVRPGGRRRADRGHRRLPQGAHAGREGGGRRAVRVGRHLPLAPGGRARAPRAGRDLRRRRRGAPGGRGSRSRSRAAAWTRWCASRTTRSARRSATSSTTRAA